MNKDVIYIEPEDDITSIIRKLNASSHKLVALVPPKRIGVLRSAVNTRLIAKNAKQAGKTVVIVSSDPSLTKLSAAAGIPVADTLQSRPKLPDDILGAPAKEAIPSEITIEEGKMTVSEGDSDEKTDVAEEKPAKGPRPAKTTKTVDDEINSVELEEEAAKESSDKDGKEKKSKIPDLDKHKKLIIAGIVGGILMIVFLVWAFVFAPAAEILVSIRTTGNNFSENVSFVTEANKEKAEEGIFYLDKQTYNADNSVDFEATGEKDVGEKATGNLTVTLSVTNKAPVTLAKGTVFTNGGRNYLSDKEVTYQVQDDDDPGNCTSGGTLSNPITTCTFSATIPVTAAESGEKYNVAAGTSGWTTAAASGAKITNDAISGGSSKVIKVVTQSDVDKAKSKLQESAESAGKSRLLEQFSDDIYKIESSYKVESKNPVASPAVGEEVKDGVKPKLTQTTTYSMYGVDTNKFNEFIKKKTESSLASDQKIYATGTPFLENFREDKDKITARLKSTTQTGPSVTEEEILEKSKGLKIGDVQAVLKSINGVSSVKINPSFFWVNSIPNDSNKITVELKVEE